MEPNTTREELLTVYAIELRPWFEAKARVTVPEFRVSTGFPAGSRGSIKHAIGQCWDSKDVKDGIPAVFISPVLDDAVQVISTLAHEMVHVAHPGEGHRGLFKTTALAIGLTGAMTATVANPEFKAEAERIIKYAGDYAEIHGKIDPNDRKKQGTRLLKAVCIDDTCGFIARVTAKWRDEVAHLCITGALRLCRIETKEEEE